MVKTIHFLLPLCLSVCLSSALFSQKIEPNAAQKSLFAEICDNQIDDDADGLIDCYDADCQCVTDIPCSIASLPSKFETRLAWKAPQSRGFVTCTPVIGNMNPQVDNMPEIIVAESATLDGILASPSNRILFYRGDGSNAANPMVLTLPSVFATDPVPGPTIGDVDGDGNPEMLMVCFDRRIRVYHDYTENPVAPMTIWMTSIDLTDFNGQRPLLADFDSDGISEVYVGNDIFRFDLSNPAAPSLKRVLDGPTYLGSNSMGRSYWRNYLRTNCNPTPADLLTPADCNGDPDCNGLELAAGPAIYSIDLDLTDGDGYEIKMQRRLPHTATVQYYDGYTAVADIDLDGILDVIVSSKYNADHGVYAYNKNGLIGFLPYPHNTFLSGAVPCIANVFDDKTAGFAQDFPEILLGTGFSFSAFNFQKAQQTPVTPYWWDIDFSGSGGNGFNPATTFDFNGDGISEILYRSTALKVIYGGAAPFPPGVAPDRTWFVASSTANTVSDDYALIADVDNDGEVEIAGCFGFDNPAVAYSGRVGVYESAKAPWVPCRNLWNQYNYFAVNVNDDLSIPKTQQAHHLEFPGPGSGKRPLNQYLTQRPALGAKIALPDAAAEVESVYCQNNQLHLKLKVCNNGDRKLDPGTPLAFYKTDPRITNAVLAIPPVLLNAGLEIDSCAVFDLIVPATTGTLYGVVNDNGSIPRPYNLATDFPANDVYECDWLNNIFEFNYAASTSPLHLGQDLALCKDTLLLLNAGSGHFSYQWQDGSTDSTLLVQTPGLYWVAVQDQCIGFRRDSIQIDVFGYPQMQIDTVNGDCSGLQGSAVVSAQTQRPPLVYAWSTGSTNPTLNAVPDGLYTVTVTDALGCSSVDSSWLEAGGLLAVMADQTDIPCMGQTGSIDLTISTGKAPFFYNWSNGTNANNLPNAPAGLYTVTVTDADGCSQVRSVDLAEPPALSLTGISITGACVGELNGAIQFADVTNGVLPYDVKWSDGSNGAALSGVQAGDYTVTVTDAKGCIVSEMITIPALLPPVLDPFINAISCFGANNGSILVSVSGGTAPFGFSWSNASNTPEIQNLGPGNYTLALTYAGGQCSQTFDFQVDEPLELLSAGINALGSCVDVANGSVSLTGISQGTAPYVYQWSDGSTGVTALNGVSSGVYTVTVTDANGCSIIESVDIEAFDAPLVAPAIHPVSCAGLADGSIQLGIFGGVSGLTFQWSNGATTADNLQLAAGNYSLTLGYAGGQCTLPVSFQITEPAPLVSNGITALAACPNQPNGSAVFAGAGQGTAPYSLKWSTGDISPNLNGIPTGQYELTITDAKGCTLSDMVFVPSFTAPQLDTISQDITCFGAADGSVTVNASGGSPGLGYNWSNGFTTASLQGLGPGNYTLTLTYATGQCAESFDFQVVEPLPLLSAGVTVVPACPGIDNGSVQLTGISQGTAPYNYQWSEGSTSPDLSGLPAGAYTLEVTDAKGCTLTETAAVPVFEAPGLNAAVTNVSCAGFSDGQLVLAVSGGAPNLAYQWSGGQTTADIAQLSAGTYTLTVTYADGRCADLYQYTIAEPAPLLSNGIFVTPTCPGTANGVLEFNGAQQGNPPYIIAWSTGSNAAQQTNLQAGLYALTVIDSKGCTVSESIQLTAYEAPSLDTVVHGVSCFGKNDGAISVDLTGGSPGYSFTWSNNAATADLQDLGPGNYTLELGFANGSCSQKFEFFISEPLPLLSNGFVTTASCPGEAKGTAGFLGATQGTAPYSWQWSTGSTNTVLTNLAGGIYSISLTDAQGCTRTETVQVPELTLPIVEYNVQNINCFGLENGSIDLVLSGGTPGFGYHWSTGASSEDLNALESGNYALTLTYGDGLCEAQYAFEILEPSELSAQTTQIEPVNCFGASTGALSVNPLGGTAPYQFIWQDGQTTDKRDQLAAGLYMVTITDANGCTETDEITLSQPDAISLAESSETITCRFPSVSVGVTTNQNNAQYEWSGPGGALPNQPTQQVSIPGTYQITLTNEFGCTATTQLQVLEDRQSPLAEIGPNQIQVPCQQSALTLDATAGSSTGTPFEQSWYFRSDSLTNYLSSSPKITVQQPGWYLFYNLNTDNGCVASDSVLVDWVLPVSASLSVDSISCFGAADGVITVQQVAGGTAPYFYSIDNQLFGATPVFQDLEPGAFTVYLRDMAGCSWQSTVVLNEPSAIAVKLSASDTLIDLGHSVLLDAKPVPSGIQLGDIQWFPQLNGMVQGALHQRVDPIENTEFLVQITDQYGCTASDRVQVEVVNYRIYTPNVFAPGSLQNGIFTVFAGPGIENIRILRVYDRWGGLVFENKNFAPGDLSAGWDGRIGSTAAGPGVFVWYAELEGKDGRVLRLNGDVTIAP
jgi:hypothetical protein